MSPLNVPIRRNRLLLPLFMLALLAVVLLKCSIHRFVDSQAAQAAQATPSTFLPPSFIVMSQLRDSEGKGLVAEYMGDADHVASCTFVQLAAGGDHTCALTAEGVAYCWGANEFGQLGNGPRASTACGPSSPCAQSPVMVDMPPL